MGGLPGDSGSVLESVPVDEPRSILAEQPTPEAAKAALIAELGKVIDELQKDESYCGVAIEVHRLGSAEGKIACIQLFPCDDIGGNPARRI